MLPAFESWVQGTRFIGVGLVAVHAGQPGLMTDNDHQVLVAVLDEARVAELLDAHAIALTAQVDLKREEDGHATALGFLHGVHQVFGESEYGGGGRYLGRTLRMQIGHDAAETDAAVRHLRVLPADIRDP